jgi:hypothetical protein
MVPFGLSNAPTILICLMNDIFRDHLDKFVIVFLDYILIYSKFEEEHEKHLSMVLEILREHRLYAKLSKCSFYHKKIHYLGHIISEEGIKVDLEKIRAIEGWPKRRNVSEVRSFMGLVGYYRIFFEGLSNVTHPITSLQNKVVKFECVITLNCLGSFSLF